MATLASSPLSRASERVGTVLKGKWRLDAVIGVGGMAAVFSATHRNGSRVAIKVLNPEYAAQPEFVARFMREGYVANKINHPSSVLVLDDDAEDGCAFLVMELLSGHSLERYTRRDAKRLPLGQVIHVADQVLDLLAVAHGHGILHRDIKPANILVTAEGVVKVLDFGIARLAERAGDVGATQTGSSLGTPSYMPPEQARGRWNMVDPRTDLWALGATMHALILGERPRRAETVQEEMLLAMTAPLRSLRESMPGTPPAVVAFVDTATAFEMEGRFPDALTMQRALRDLAAGLNVSAAPLAAVLGGPGSSAALGAEPGSTSGPRPDTAGMVPPPSRPDRERDPMTLHATENTTPPVPTARPHVAAAIGVAAAALILGLGLGVRALLVRPPPVEPATTFGATTEARPGAATSPVASTAPLPRPAPAPPPAASPVVATPPTTVVDEIDDPAARGAPAPAASEQRPSADAPARASAAVTTPTPRAPTDTPAPRRAKPTPGKLPASSPLFDERF